MVMLVMDRARSVIVRSWEAGFVVVQNHAEACRGGGCSLDRNSKRQREGNQDAGESWQQGLNSNPAVCMARSLQVVLKVPLSFPR
jgi:hypothetical protein